MMTCALAEEVGLGLYSGIFVMYLQHPSNKSRTSIILYALCLLYILSTATIVSDLLTLILGVSINSISKNSLFFFKLVVQLRFSTLSPQLHINSDLIFFRLTTIQSIASGCCDFLAQCILVRINRCTYYHSFYLFT